MKQTVIAIVGPTAVGKTKLSIDIAKQFNGCIINGDSMQVYKGLDIGTAKIKPSEMQGISHYMFDTRLPHESFSVAEYRHDVQSYIHQVSDAGYLPIIVGGSGLYIQAALYDYQFTENKRDPERTMALQQQIDHEGAESLHAYLQTIDPIQATKIHPNNHRRLIRAIEIYETTGQTMTEREKTQNDSPYDLIFIGLEMERTTLYQRINERVDTLMAEGLLEEVANLVDQGLENAQSMRGIGYKELIPYLKGEQTLDDALVNLKQNSRRYAKRQYTWFKNKLPVHWYDVTPGTTDGKFEIILADLAGILQGTSN